MAETPTNYPRLVEQGTILHLNPASNTADASGGMRFADLTANTTGDKTAALVPGVYDIWANTDCYIARGTSSATQPNATTGYLLRANQNVTTYVPPGNMCLFATAASVNGTFSGCRVG